MRAIGDDFSCTVEDGGVQSNAGPIWGTPIDVRPIGTDANVDNKLETVKFKAFADTVNSYRGVSRDTSIDFTFYVPATGTLGTLSLGHYIRVKIKPISPLVSGLETYIGILTNQKEAFGSGQEQKETWTIQCFAE